MHGTLSLTQPNEARNSGLVCPQTWVQYFPSNADAFTASSMYLRRYHMCILLLYYISRQPQVRLESERHRQAVYMAQIADTYSVDS